MLQIDEDASRCGLCLFRLEADNSTLTWSRPGWSALRGGAATPDFVLHSAQNHAPLHVICARYSAGNTEENFNSVDEGYLDVLNIKEVYLDEELVHERVSLLKRYGQEYLDAEHLAAITIVHGNCMSANHRLCFVGPRRVTSAWHRGLCRLRCAAIHVKGQVDRRVSWLKQQYLQLYYDNEKCQGPTPAEALKVR